MAATDATKYCFHPLSFYLGELCTAYYFIVLCGWASYIGSGDITFALKKILR